MSDDYDKIAELVRNGYDLDDALNKVSQTSILPPSGTVTAAMIDTTTLNPIVQVVRDGDGKVATGTTELPSDDSIPQNTEGDEYLTVAITPQSTTNLLLIRAQAILSHSSATGRMGAALFQDATASALVASHNAKDAAVNGIAVVTLSYSMTAGTTSSTTFKIRAGAGLAGTTTFNGSGGTRIYGGVMNSFLEVEEILQ